MTETVTAASALFQNTNSKSHILIKGARTHNLKNVSLAIPRNKFVVFTGVSGSGKSSLIIDTLFAEGQRRYVESLSSYARQFLTRMNKPDVDFIKGISPAIAIEQKVNTKNSRSTVGTLTEIYDYLRLLYARIGKTYSPISKQEVKRNDVTDVVNYIHSLPEETKIHLLIPFKEKHNRTFKEELNVLLQKGFSRMMVNGEVMRVEDLLNKKLESRKERIEGRKEKGEKNKKKISNSELRTPNSELFILIDRFVVKKDDEDSRKRIADSVQTAFFESDGECLVEQNSPLPKGEGSGVRAFSNRFELDGMTFEEPSPHFFSFNNPYGACKKCEGFGSVIGIDEDLVIPNKSLSIYEGAIACWKGEKMSEWNEQLIHTSLEFDFPIHRAYCDLTEEEKQVLWEGNGYFRGLNEFFRHLEKESYKIQYRVMLSRYRGKTICPECKGTRLRKDAGYVKINGKSISDLVLMQIADVLDFFKKISLKEYEQKIAKRILTEIITRLQLMLDVGLNYLTLNRLSGTLSGGETQRINLTRTLGSNLTSSLYILDEPSVGLHPRDTKRLVKVLESLRDLGNTVLVVEHEEEMMKAADRIVDMGPLAGTEGGEIIAEGNLKEILKDENSLTGKYLSGKMSVRIPKARRKATQFIEVSNARLHNLKNISAKFPLNTLTVVTGVSGSGKTTLVKYILYPSIKKMLESFGNKSGIFEFLSGDLSALRQVEMIDQNPLGRSSRSNPVTYVKAYDSIRDLFANQKMSKVRGFQPRHFSFNVEGGRCEICKGEGDVVVEMQFLADVHLVCEECKGKRFKQEILEVLYKSPTPPFPFKKEELNISEVLELTVDEAMEFFRMEKNIYTELKPLADVGLGYIKLGQSSSTLSGGEAQRVKLASFLGKGKSSEPVLFIFDEPTTGLHFHDIGKLLKSFDMLIENGHSIIVIEHNPEVVKCADWVIDLGPEGGEDGGHLVAQGTPEEIMKNQKSWTGKFLKEKL